MPDLDRFDDNPWCRVPPEDYEAHMASPEVDQAAVLNRIVAHDLARVQPRRLVVLGCATGNGFEHIDPAVTERVVGIDVNRNALNLLNARYGDRLPGLELLHEDVHAATLPEASADLIHAALIFEYLDVKPALARIADWLVPDGWMTVVLQRPSDEAGAVSPTPYRSLEALGSLLELVDPNVFATLAADHGLAESHRTQYPLKQGKAFWVGRFQKTTA